MRCWTGNATCRRRCSCRPTTRKARRRSSRRGQRLLATDSEATRRALDALDALDDDAFRLEVRRWVEANYPPELRNPPKRLHWRESRVWYRKLAEQGWLAPGWPRALGGMGLSAARQMIMVEEFERHGVSRSNDHGIVMLG